MAVAFLLLGGHLAAEDLYFSVNSMKQAITGSELSSFSVYICSKVSWVQPGLMKSLGNEIIS